MSLCGYNHANIGKPTEIDYGVSSQIGRNYIIK